MSKSYGNVKGSIFIYTKDYTLEVHDENVWNKILQVFTDEDRDLIDKIITKSEWYVLVNDLRSGVSAPSASR